MPIGEPSELERGFRHSLMALLLLLGMAFTACPAAALTVKDIRIGLHPDKNRVVLELSEMSKFRVFVLEDPWRLVVDMPEFAWQVGRISNPKASEVAGIRQGLLQPGISRMVIGLKNPVSVHDAFLLRKNNQGRPDRLVIDFSKTTQAAWQKEKDKSFGVLEIGAYAAAAVAPAAAPAPQKPPPVRKTEPALQQAAASGIAIPQRKPLEVPPRGAVPVPGGGKKPLIVLDPGHGGVDPGAIGANGVFEKHIALSMAKELKALLESSGRYEVKLTRYTDTFLKLNKRVSIARERNADLFVSLHADSIGKSNVRGASVYTLSEKASDEQTARLAERENKADIIAGTDLSHEDEQVANILIALSMRDTMNQSQFFANTVRDSLDGHQVRLLEKPVRHAGFAVLKAPDVPSVLIELGFMSNRSEARQLSDPAYRQKIARALAAGIDAYFERLRENGRT